MTPNKFNTAFGNKLGAKAAIPKTLAKPIAIRTTTIITILITFKEPYPNSG